MFAYMITFLWIYYWSLALLACFYFSLTMDIFDLLYFLFFFDYLYLFFSLYRIFCFLSWRGIYVIIFTFSILACCYLSYILFFIYLLLCSRKVSFEEPLLCLLSPHEIFLTNYFFIVVFFILVFFQWLWNHLVMYSIIFIDGWISLNAL